MHKLLKHGFVASLVSFILLFVGIRFILGNEINITNIMAFIIFSLLVGVFTAILVFFKLKIAYISFWIGCAFGFFLMYTSFLGDTSGWGDLIGVVSLLFSSLIGLGIGLLGQLAFYIFKKYKKTS